MIKEIIIKATGEKLMAYKLKTGNWYDYNGMGKSDPPTSRTGKKEFLPDEVTEGKEVKI